MDVGSLRHLITIEHQVKPDPTAFDQTPTWVVFAQAWASVDDLSGRELETAKQLHSETTTKIVIRYLPGLDTSMRILHASKVYDILYILNIDHNDIILTLGAKVSG